MPLYLIFIGIKITTGRRSTLFLFFTADMASEATKQTKSKNEENKPIFSL